MKRHIVVLVGGYGNNPSPSGLIMEKLINVWKQEADISVIAYKNSFELLDEEFVDQVRIYRIKEKNRLLQNYYKQNISYSKNPISKCIFKLLLFLRRALHYIYRVMRKESINQNYVKRVLSKLEEIEKEKKIDCIISAVEPHENSASAYLYKRRHSDVNWIIYQLDRFSNANSLYESNLIRKIREKKHVKREIDYLKLCNKLFVLNPIYSHYDTATYKEYLYKIIPTDHPLLDAPVTPISGNSSDCIKLIYGGSLDKTLRNPQRVLEIISKANKFSNMQASFYTYGNCGALIKEYQSKNPGIICAHQPVSRRTLVECISESDVLISIGNDSDNEIPSKFFDYLSFGLPIVHFYFSRHDEILNYLDNYPLALSICIKNEIDLETVMGFADFCKRAKGMTFSFDYISSIYKECTPFYVAEVFSQYF